MQHPRLDFGLDSRILASTCSYPRLHSHGQGGVARTPPLYICLKCEIRSGSRRHGFLKNCSTHNFSLGCRNEVILFLKVLVGTFPTTLLGVPTWNFEKCLEKFLDAHVPRPFPHRASMRGPQFFARMSEWGDSFFKSACWNISNNIARGSDLKFRKMPREIFRCPRSKTVPAPS